MATVTSIGIGNMGAALATALVKSSSPSFKLTIWNRTASRPQVQALISEGATFEPSLPAAVAKSDVLLLCLLDYPSISSVFAQLDAPAKPLAGKLVLNLTNGTPRQAREMAEFCKSLGAAAYFDGGVMVTPQLVGTPAGFVVLSGETEQAYEERVAAAGLLKPVGAVLYIAPDAGAASLVDCSALAAMYGMFTGAFTGMGLLQRQLRAQGGAGGDAKVAVKPLVDKVMVPMLNALVPYVALLADQIDREDWMNDLGNPLSMQAEGVRNIMQACVDEGVEPTGLKLLIELMERGIKEGFGPGGLAIVGKYFLK